jgi:hypothetical protein
MPPLRHLASPRLDPLSLSPVDEADVDAARAAGRIHECTTGFYLDEPAETRDEANQRAHREAIQASAEPSRAFDAMRETLRNGIQVVSAPQLFPTPPDLADRLIELADIRAGHTILEPSAGTGALLDALQHKPLDYIGGLSVVEINPRLAEVLQAKGYTVRCADFLACNGELGAIPTPTNPEANQQSHAKVPGRGPTHDEDGPLSLWVASRSD